MATVTVVKQNVAGAQKEAIVDFAFDSSYPAGGEAFSPRDIHEGESTTSTFHFVGIEPYIDGTFTNSDNRFIFYDYVNEKLMVYTALNVEATDATDQSTVAVRCLCRWGSASG